MPGLLTETVPAATTQLTTLALAKSTLGLTDSSQDALVTSLIDRASSVISTHCGGRVFGLRTVSETFRFNRNSVAAMAGWPYPERPQSVLRPPLITSLPAATLTSVTEDAALLVRDTDFEIDQAAGLVWRLRGNFRSWWTAQVVTVVYTTGWKLPNDASRDMPADIEDHTLNLIRSAYFATGNNPNVAMDLVEGVGRTQFWDRSVSAMAIDETMDAALSRYVLRVW